jgi:hypothetical protein
MSVGRYNTIAYGATAVLPLGSRAQNRQRSPHPHSPLDLVSHCTGCKTGAQRGATGANGTVGNTLGHRGGR